MSSKIEALLEKVDIKNPESVKNFVAESIGPAAKRGDTVAVINDPAYPFEGAKGKVKSVTGGHALVEFPNGSEAHLLVSMLIPV